MSNMERCAPVSRQATVGSRRKSATNFAVQSFSLPRLHRDMAGEGVEKVDVPVGVVDDFPVKLTHGDLVEKPGGFNFRPVVL